MLHLGPRHRPQRVEHCGDWHLINNMKPYVSPYSTPPVTVPKAHTNCTQFHTAMDYRVSNTVVEYDSFPLPRCDELMAAIKSARYFSTIDLQSGFTQMENDPQTARVTAFTVRGRHCEFNVLPGTDCWYFSGSCVDRLLLSSR